MGLKIFGTTLAVFALAACSSQPREPAPAAPAAANLAPAAASPAAADAANPGASVPVLNRKLISAGYRATTIKGEIYYCRMVDMTNTTFKKRVCLTEAQLKDEERKTKEMQDQMLKTESSPSCLGPTCAG